MALPLNITINVSGDAIAKNYKYSPSMSIFDNSGLSSQPNEGNKSKDNKLNTIPTQLYIPYAFRLTRADIVKGGEFNDPKKVTDKDLICALGSQASAIRMLDYAEARTGKSSISLDDSQSSGTLKDNVDIITQLIFKNGKNLKLQNETYTIYANKIDSWKVIPKTLREKEKVNVVINISVARGKSIGFLRRQRLSCPEKRVELRESVKAVFGKDLMGEPARKPLKVVPRRLFQASSNSTSRSRGTSNRSRRRMSDAELRRLYQYNYPYRYQAERRPRGRVSPSYSSSSSQTISPVRRGGMTRKRKMTSVKTLKNRKKKYEVW